MQRDDIAYVHHVLDAACKTILFTQNRTREELDSDEMLSLSLVRWQIIEVINTKHLASVPHPFAQSAWAGLQIRPERHMKQLSKEEASDSSVYAREKPWSRNPQKLIFSKN